MLMRDKIPIKITSDFNVFDLDKLRSWQTSDDLICMRFWHMMQNNNI